MPAIRQSVLSKQPLRNRRHVKLSVCTSIQPDIDIVIEGADEDRGRKSYRTCNTSRRGDSHVRGRDRHTPENAKSNRENLVQKMGIQSPVKRPDAPIPPFTPSTPEELKYVLDWQEEDPEQTPVAGSPSAPERWDFHEIVPGLSLVVSTISCNSRLPKAFRNDFTHVIRVAADAEERETCTETDYGDEGSPIEILSLTFPVKARPSSIRTTKTARRVRNLGTEMQESEHKSTNDLTSDQLKVARDFLSLCLPYYSMVNPPSPSVPQRPVTPTQVLIIAPTHIDALSIVVTYLAFCSHEPVPIVINYINEEPDVPDAWRDVFPEFKEKNSSNSKGRYEGAENIELAAGLDL